MRKRRFSMWCRSTTLCGVAAAVVVAASADVRAQALKDVQAPDKPVVLKAQGSFFVGGEKVEQAPAELSGLGPGANGSPAYLYRFSYVQTATRERMRTGAGPDARKPRLDVTAESHRVRQARRF